MKVKHAGELSRSEQVSKTVVQGVLERWSRIGVLAGGDGRYRFFVLEPADSAPETPVELGPFFVRGRYRVVEKVNNARAASEAYKAFRPS